MTPKTIATLTIHGIPTMTKREHKQLLKWLEDRFIEAQSLNYQATYSKRYTARLIAQSPD